MSSMRSNQNILMKPYKTELEHMIIRDATQEEKDQIMYETKQELDLPKTKESLDQPRCSLIQMTPRGEKYAADGWESNRSEGIRLTGFKPKALEFVSPVKAASPLKSPPTRIPFSSASTKDNTTAQ